MGPVFEAISNSLLSWRACRNSLAKMIIHKLFAQHLKHRDDARFYFFQAQDAIAWIERAGVSILPETRALDLGCGHGIFGAELLKRGCKVTFADYENGLPAELASAPFRRIDLDRDDIGTLGEHDLIICSNVLEHLAKPNQFLIQFIRSSPPREDCI